jgi:hypothetical protein
MSNKDQTEWVSVLELKSATREAEDFAIPEMKKELTRLRRKVAEELVHQVQFEKFMSI